MTKNGNTNKTMTKKEIALVKGVILSATYKMAKQIEKGFLISDIRFLELLESCNNSDDFYFLVNEIVLTFGRENRGEPSVSILVTCNGIDFYGSFIILKPAGKFTNTTPFAQELSVEVIDK